jgi:hypothetical protein
MASSRDGVAAGGLEIRRKGTIKIVGLGWDYEGREIMSFYFIIYTKLNVIIMNIP